MDIQTCKFVAATELVPKSWSDFWGEFSSCCEFSFGDSNRTLVTVERFTYACYEIFSDSHGDTEEYIELMKNLESLGNDVYIDLEN